MKVRTGAINKVMFLLFLSWIILGRPYDLINGQDTIKKDTNKNNPPSVHVPNPPADPNILVSKEKEKLRKFDSSFALQAQIITNLRKRNRQKQKPPKTEYITVYKVVPVLVSEKDSLTYKNKSISDTITSKKYYGSIADVDKIDFKPAEEVKEKKKGIFRKFLNLFKRRDCK